MNKAQHTPGPWHIGIRQPNSDKFIYGPQGSEIADCDRLTNMPDENLANAQLIAAAPELLEALREFVDDAAIRCKNDSTPGFLTRLARGRAAIAKARGEG